MGPKKEPHAFLKLVGEKIKKERMRINLSHEAPGLEIGLTKGHVLRLEKGQNITLMTLLKVSLALGAPADKLLKVDFEYDTRQLPGLIKSKSTSKKC